MSVTVVPSALESAVVLEDIDWETYEKLRAPGANRNVRMTYDQGVLVLMSPSKLHERVAELLARMVFVWTEVLAISCQSAGSMTIKKQLLKRGFEPDKSFYVKHEGEVRGREHFDPDVDPPPDLSIEVDVTSASTTRMAIYAAFGVPEVWRWHDERIVVYRLRRAHYVESQESTCFPGFPLQETERVLGRRLKSDETTLVREFRLFVETHRRDS